MVWNLGILIEFIGSRFTIIISRHFLSFIFFFLLFRFDFYFDYYCFLFLDYYCLSIDNYYLFYHHHRRPEMMIGGIGAVKAFLLNTQKARAKCLFFMHCVLKMPIICLPFSGL